MTGADGEKRGSDHYEARGRSAGTVRGVGGVVTWHADRPPPPGLMPRFARRRPFLTRLHVPRHFIILCTKDKNKMKNPLLLVPFALLFFIGGMLVPNAIDEDLHPCMSILSHNSFDEPFQSDVHQFALTPEGDMLYNHNLELGHSCHEHFKLHFDDVNAPGRQLQADPPSRVR